MHLTHTHTHAHTHTHHPCSVLACRTPHTYTAPPAPTRACSHGKWLLWVALVYSSMCARVRNRVPYRHPSAPVCKAPVLAPVVHPRPTVMYEQRVGALCTVPGGPFDTGAFAGPTGVFCEGDKRASHTPEMAAAACALHSRALHAMRHSTGSGGRLFDGAGVVRFSGRAHAGAGSVCPPCSLPLSEPPLSCARAHASISRRP